MIYIIIILYIYIIYYDLESLILFKSGHYRRIFCILIVQKIVTVSLHAIFKSFFVINNNSIFLCLSINRQNASNSAMVLAPLYAYRMTCTNIILFIATVMPSHTLHLIFMAQIAYIYRNERQKLLLC